MNGLPGDVPVSRCLILVALVLCGVSWEFAMKIASRKIALAAAAMALLAGQGVAALAVSDAVSDAGVDRVESPVGKAEKVIGAPIMILFFAALSGGVVAMSGQTTDNPAPVSP